MEGFLSLFSCRSGYRRSKSLVETAQHKVEDAASIPSSVAHRIETSAEFKPVEHPTEPLHCEQPINCPMPEPSILNDGRVWKARLSSSRSMMLDLSVEKEGSQSEPDGSRSKPRPRVLHRRHSLPSHSAPEHDLMGLLEECNLAEDTVGY